MDELSTIQVSHDSSIMDSSFQTSRFRWKWPIIIGIFIILVGSVISLMIGLSASLSVPEQPLVLVFSTPYRLQKFLTPAQQQLLPPAWKAALRTKSHWPVMFGLTRETEHWNGFALGPRWSIGTDPSLITMKSKLVTAVYDNPIEESSSKISYSSAFMQSLRHPFSLFSAKIFPPTDQIHSFNLFESHHELQTDLTFHEPANSKDIKKADLSLNFFQDNLFSLLNTQFKLGSQTLQSFQNKPSQLSLLLDDQMNPAKTSIVFDQPPSPDEIGKLLSSYGIQTTRIITLPDGTQALDRSALQNIQGEFTTTTKYGALRWTGNELILGQTTSSFETAPPACPNLHPAVRLSSQLIAKLLAIDPSIAIPDIQIGEKQEKLVICVEK